VKRDDLHITSKLWSDCHEPVAVAPALTKTLKDLKLDYLDLYLIHWPQREDAGGDWLGYKPDWLLETWREMEKEVEAGRVKAIGLCNCTKKKIQELLSNDLKVRPSVLQVELHPYFQQEELVAFCKTQGITVTAYAPLGSPGRWAHTIDADDPSVLDNELVKEIAVARGKTAAQVVLRWALQRGTIPIPKSTNPARIKANFGVDFKLTAEDMEKMKRWV
jgi:diketogulonate reductase-like aldo/keto reductase